MRKLEIEYTDGTTKTLDMWRVEITYTDGTVKTVTARDKFDAGMKRDHYIHKCDVERADVFDGDDYIDPVEL